MVHSPGSASGRWNKPALAALQKSSEFPLSPDPGLSPPLPERPTSALGCPQRPVPAGGPGPGVPAETSVPASCPASHPGANLPGDPGNWPLDNPNPGDADSGLSAAEKAAQGQLGRRRRSANSSGAGGLPCALAGFQTGCGVNYALSPKAAGPSGALATLSPHLSLGSCRTRDRCARIIHRAGARESRPGVRRDHALPGAGGEAARLPSAAQRAGALLFPAPRGFPKSTPRHTPTLPHPGETGRGPEPRDPGRAALRSAFLSRLHRAWAGVGMPRPLLLQEPQGLGEGVLFVREKSRDPGGKGQMPGARWEPQHRVRAWRAPEERWKDFRSFQEREKGQGLRFSEPDGVFSGSSSQPVCRQERAGPAGIQRAAGLIAT
ncbi:hypothetical protein P7K49_037975 [Saguinus oedipus]|uniref:Uncharacterized protein n=1 Tax=Saguinus oedipus TaxID=9490 RepID=A0ABQ9TDB3_SAGOE|nr:hypothetical protein P7K49_037975 [Saguinus oedipus]